MGRAGVTVVREVSDRCFPEDAIAQVIRIIGDMASLCGVLRGDGDVEPLYTRNSIPPAFG